MCGAMDGGAEAPHGCAARSGFWKASAKNLHAQHMKAANNSTVLGKEYRDNGG
ncbi:hypothetical protein DOQ08_01337 [Marinobacter litoralis]|uniref:Uncharacterized protein n=1 Tax=Marinobacter litoralis TaxID=187981 RepID=A0A3M2RFC3_9GAMM|nr:hypothetical protein DOQ08_01337 [Marinobacter litoralis]